MEEPNKPGKVTQHANQYLKFANLGLQLVVTLAIAGAGGYYMDKRIGWQFPVFLLLFLMIALAGSIYLLIKRISDE